MHKYKIGSIISVLLIAVLVIPSGCTADPVTTTVTETKTQSTTVILTTTLPANTVIETKTVTETKTASTISSTTETTQSTTDTASIPTQPQVITSADGKLQILHYETNVLMGGKQTRLEGAIKNLSSSAVNARITVDYYNIRGEIYDSSELIIEGLQPNITKAFAIDMAYYWIGFYITLESLT